MKKLLCLTLALCLMLAACGQAAEPESSEDEPEKTDVRTELLFELFTSNKDGRFDALENALEAARAEMSAPESLGVYSDEASEQALDGYYMSLAPLVTEERLDAIKREAFMYFVDDACAKAGVVLSPISAEYSDERESAGGDLYCSFTLTVKASSTAGEQEASVTGSIAVREADGARLVSVFAPSGIGALREAINSLAAEGPEPAVDSSEPAVDSPEPAANFTVFHTLDDVVGRRQNALEIAGETEDTFIVTYKWEGQAPLHVWALLKEDCTVLAHLELDNAGGCGLTNNGERLVFHGRDTVQTYNYALELQESIPVPERIRARLAELTASSRHACYEVSADGGTFWYNTEDGLIRYDKASGEETLLVEAYTGGSPLGDITLVPTYFWLRAGGKCLFYVTLGYEGAAEISCVDGEGTRTTLTQDGFLGFIACAPMRYSDIFALPEFLSRDDGEGYDIEVFAVDVATLAERRFPVSPSELEEVFIDISGRYCTYMDCDSGEILVTDTTAMEERSAGAALKYGSAVGVLSDGRVLSFYVNSETDFGLLLYDNPFDK